MKAILLPAFISLIAFSFSFGQGTVRGKVTDENGEPAIGATVILKSNRSVGTNIGLDGNYSLKIPDSVAQVLVVSYIGYQTIEGSVTSLNNNKVVIKNFDLKPAANEMKEVQIVGKATKAKDYYMEKMKINSSVSVDYISSEIMKKTGDANVVAAVARVPGVSTNGGFITVRGIGDRYVKTSINGLRIPTLDPFTNNIKLDLFPASLIDNVIITKTANPDLPGDWAGAYLSIETKDYPEKLSVNVETSVGYNNQTSFKDVITSQRSVTDWLGYDNGFRDHSHNNFVPANMNPSPYDEFVALGLGDYYKSLGVTNNALWNYNSDTYYKLGLVQLGLLAPALINDPKAVTDAISLYNSGPYRNEAFETLNTGAVKSAQSFPANWSTFFKKAPLSFSQSFSIGDQAKLLGKQFGFICGFRYGSSILYDPNSISNRAAVVGGPNGGLVNTVSSSIDQKESKETNGWSALIKVACKINSNNNISLLFMPNLTGTNKVRYAYDYGDIKTDVLNQSQFYEQRKQMVYQLKTDNYLPDFRIKIEFAASYTDGKSSAPDFKNVTYWRDPLTGVYQIGGSIGDGVHRYYRYLSDNIFDSHLSAEFPISNIPGLARKIKFGGAYQRNDRKNDQYDYQVQNNPNFAHPLHLISDNIDQYLSLNNFSMYTYTNASGQDQSTMDLYYTQNNSPANHTIGNSTTKAGFVMMDYSIISRLRFSGGLRVEQANIFTDVFKFDSLHLVPNDPRRDYLTGMPAANPGQLDKISYLPSANVIYKLKNDEDAPVNLRFNYSQTVARPSIRELSDVGVFDYQFRTFVIGYSNLKIVQVNNYDVRTEWYFKNGDNLSASTFYKEFKNHIELVQASFGNTWKNVDEAWVEGIDLDGKKKITKYFDLRVNITLVNSRTIDRTGINVSGSTRIDIPLDSPIIHPMYGQAPYVVNGIFAYTADSIGRTNIGLTAALSYNVQGPRLVIVSFNRSIPDIYELPRNMLDFKITKTLGKYFSLSFMVKDILNTPIRRSYKYPEGFTLDYDRYRFGTNYVISVSYKILK